MTTTNAVHPPRPNLEKLSAVADEFSAIKGFLEWIGNHPDYNICIRVDRKVGMNYPLTADDMDKTVYEYFELDRQAIDRERAALLDFIQEQAATS